MTKFISSANIKNCANCKLDKIRMEVASGDIICLSCGLVLAARIIDESDEHRDFADDEGPSQSRAEKTSSKYGGSLTTFMGGSEDERKILARMQDIATDSRELRILKHIHHVKDLASRLDLPKSIQVCIR